MINSIAQRNLVGYDLDGVICSKSPKSGKSYFKQNAKERKEYWRKRLEHCLNAKVLIRPKGRFIIITARKAKNERIATYLWLIKNRIKPERIYFLELPKTRENIIAYKSEIINKEKLKVYYDDDSKICIKLKEFCKNTEIQWVK